MIKNALVIGTAIAGTVAASHAFAVTFPTTLDALTQPGVTFTEGDKTFSAFTATPSGLPAINAVPNTSVGVTQFAPGQFGINFGSLWTVDSTGGADREFSDTLITYDLSVDPASGQFVTSVDLDLTGFATGDAAGSVTETVIDLDHPGVSYSLFATTKTNQLAQVISIAPTRHLSLTKDINVKAGYHGSEGEAEITGVRNSFHQSAIPEPMSLTLLPLAIAGLGLRKKLAR